jgi:hypothetical protein
MKTMYRILFLALFSIFVFNACAVHHNHTRTNKRHVPPGKAKKIEGTKSAKPFAPGQRKKRKNLL